MGACLRAFDWASTALGPATRWPASLRTVVRLMLTTNHPVFVFWGPDHICLYNDAYSRSLGPEKHPSILGRPGGDAWPEIWADIGPQIHHVMAGRGATWHENQLLAIHRHGRLDEVYWTYSYGPIDDEQAPSGVGGVLVLCTETTSQVRAQQALRAAEARWKLLFDQTPGFVCVLDGPAHRYEFANPRYLELVGAADVTGRTVRDVMPDIEAQGFIALLDWVYQTGQTYSGTAVPLRLRHATGGNCRLHYVDFVYQPIRDDAGRVTGIFVEGSDVTERVQATAALTDSEARYRALAEHLPGGAVFVVDHELRYVTVAGEALKAAGFAPQQFIGRTLAQVLGPELTAAYEPHYRRALDGEAFELEHAAHGRFYLTRGVPLFSAAGAVYGVLAASYDITARRAVEEQLQAASARLDGVMAAAEVGVWTWDLRRDSIEHDRNFAQLYGLGSATESTLGEHFGRIHPEDVPTVQAAMKGALATGALYVREYRVFGADGSLHWLAARGKLQRDAAGAPAALSGLVIDISDLKAMEESLKASDRQKDEFLAILAHELRNPLAPLLNATRILAAPSLGSHELAWCRSVIQRQVQHMALLLDDLMDLSRIKQGQVRLAREPVLLAGIVAAAVETAQPLIDARQHHLRVELPEQAVMLEADPARMAQVLANLLNNAAKYTNPGGDIVLGARQVQGGVEISVRDNGIGLANDDYEHIFGMFSQVVATVDRAQGGLGIGLALVKGLVELHGGEVRVRSAGAGCGSTFTVTLPTLRISAPGVPEAPVQPAAGTPRRRILIADDNADSAQSLSMLLELDGHVTCVVADGAQALAAYASFEPDVGLIDIGMPGLNGYEVAQRIRRQPLGSQVLLAALTGWGQQEDKRKAEAAGFDLHFTKPIDLDDLLKALGTATVETRQSARAGASSR